ncbi:MAG TPA: hypothetical protein PKO36_17755, partial [Candidatus Hydrogenedentes bacterium]|nr:hypothetical protein [Candidatus Hydrogenedentota bacterium]HOV74121.1 hypothetical protein [Candidatus Hydrogenedentota bacterium]
MDITHNPISLCARARNRARNRNRSQNPAIFASAKSWNFNWLRKLPKNFFLFFVEARLYGTKWNAPVYRRTGVYTFSDRSNETVFDT